MAAKKEEIWKPVEGFQSRYEISNRGRLKSLIGKEPKVMASTRQAKGYTMYRLIDANKKHHYFIANRLVAMHFLPAPAHGEKYVVPKDGNKRNCSADNLYWSRTIEQSKRENPEEYNEFINRDSALVLRERAYTNGDDVSTLARHFGLHRSTVNKVIFSKIKPAQKNEKANQKK